MTHIALESKHSARMNVSIRLPCGCLLEGSSVNVSDLSLDQHEKAITVMAGLLADWFMRYASSHVCPEIK